MQCKGSKKIWLEPSIFHIHSYWFSVAIELRHNCDKIFLMYKPTMNLVDYLNEICW